MFDYLEGFEKRMQFVAVTESIVNRKNTNMEIEGWFEKDQMDNLFFSLLVYIMEQTLNENDECTLENIAKFLDDVLPQYNVNISFTNVTRLAEYMIKDILQNKGVLRTYGAMDYEKGWQSIAVRLISDKITDDNRIVYQLTDQGYDFLFRTKEVDKELDFKLEQMKLKELLRRKNYKHALKQSRDLIAMLRQKKREMEEFVYRIRQNIHSINRGEHERLLNETYDLIDEEYKGMEELKLAVVRDEERIVKEMQEHMNVEEPMRGALDNLNKIKRNLQIVIAEQRNLIGKRFRLNDVYEDTIKTSFYASMVKRYDFEEEILGQLEAVNEKNFSNLWMLMSPLLQPRPNKKLNLMLLYQNQSKLQENEEEVAEIEAELLEEDRTQTEIRRKNRLNYKIMEKLFAYAAIIRQPFSFSQFYLHLQEEKEKIRIFNQLIGTNRIQVYVYKIDMNESNSGLKKWEEAIAENSGGEKFVVFFTMISVLISYTREAAGRSLGVDAMKDSKVILMDNPFARTSSEHLLKAVIDIAKTFNIQLICLSDLSQSSITNRFALIYQLAVRKKMYSEKEMLKIGGVQINKDGIGENERLEHAAVYERYVQRSLFDF